MVHHISIKKAGIRLGELAKRVHAGKQYFILEKDGIPVVGLMDAEELEDYLEARDPNVRRFIAKSHREYQAGKSRSARQLLAEVRRYNARNQPKRGKR